MYANEIYGDTETEDSVGRRLDPVSCQGVELLEWKAT